MIDVRTVLTIAIALITSRVYSMSLPGGDSSTSEHYICPQLRISCVERDMLSFHTLLAHIASEVLVIVFCVILIRLVHLPFFFFFNNPAPPEISPFPLHAPLPIWAGELRFIAESKAAGKSWVFPQPPILAPHVQRPIGACAGPLVRCSSGRHCRRRLPRSSDPR